MATLQDMLKLTTAALCEQHKVEKSTTVALSEQQHTKEFAAMRDKLNTVIQETNSTKSLADPERAKIESEAEQAKHELIFKLMKRKELDGAGFSAFDEQLPLPGVLAAQYTACGQATTWASPKLIIFTWMVL
jgi:hypothetical protein